MGLLYAPIVERHLLKAARSRGGKSNDYILSAQNRNIKVDKFTIKQTFTVHHTCTTCVKIYVI